jgi:hypothetical protein
MAVRNVGDGVIRRAGGRRSVSAPISIRLTRKRGKSPVTGPGPQAHAGRTPNRQDDKTSESREDAKNAKGKKNETCGLLDRGG